MAGLYVHIPFCRSRCRYCRFVSCAGRPESEVDGYLELLEREAAHVRGKFSPAPFSTVYIGGGTPSALSVGRLERLFRFLSRRLPWKKGAEITCEVNPGDMDFAKARSLRSLGVTRVSVGVQTFSPRLLKTLGRLHTAGDSLKTFGFLRRAGFDNISCDLIVCLPGQRLRDLESDLVRLRALAPDQVTVYELVVEPGTAFAALQKRRLLRLPSEKLQLAMHERVQSALSRAGFMRYELLSFARPGKESHHNINYWKNGSYLGLGAGAHSCWEGRRFSMAEGYAAYVEKAGRGDFSPAFEERLDEKQRQCESLLLSLRLSQGAREKDFPLLAGHLARELPPLFRAGLVFRRGGRVALTARGKLLAETVFAALSLG